MAMRPSARLILAASLLACGRCCALWAAEDFASDVDRYAKLSRPQQSALLQYWLEQRFNQAAVLAKSDEDRARTERRFAEVLRRVANGSELSTAGLTSLLAEVAKTEQAAIDQLSLRYRVLVYSRFRTDRAEYDRRMAAWRKVMANWQASPAKARDAELALKWIEQSLRRMQYDEAAVLPNLPAFGVPAVAQDIEASELEPGLFETPKRQSAAGAIQTPRPHSADAPQLPSVPQLTIAPATKRTTPDDAIPTINSSPRIAHRVEKPPLPVVPSPPRAVRRPVQAVIDIPEPAAGHQPDAEPTPIVPVVRVDLQQLAERVQGFNQAFRGLTGKLQNEGVWTIDQLADTLAELADLADRRSQLSLYLDIISADERGQTGNLASLDAAVALLGGKIFAAREQPPENPRQRDFHASALDELSRRLALLAAKRSNE